MPDRQLLLLRHAKSSWRDPSLADHDRPLNRRGRGAAALMGIYLLEKDLLPDLVLCSTALRTQETWQRLDKAVGSMSVDIRMDRRLYHATPRDILLVVSKAPESAKRVMVIGHNPGLEQLAMQLSGSRSDGASLADMQVKYPTGALACFQVDASGWTSIGEHNCRLTSFTVPAKLELDPA
ncbi:MAG: histidine phosphatase family protein [Pseudomonadota bacterium]